MSTPLKIAYFNARGLSPPKFTYALSLLQSYHIVFVSETWFLNYIDHVSHPLCIAYSPPSQKRPQQGHAINGLLCLARAPLHTHLNAVTATTFTITLTIHSSTIIAGYFPPSLPTATITQILTTQKCDVLLGDINTRYGARFQDKTTGPRDRMTAFQQISSIHHLRHLLPDPSSTAVTRVDHAFAKATIPATLQFSPIDFGHPGVATDHPLLSLSLTLNLPNPASTSTNTFTSGLRRFYLQNLNNAVTVSQLNDLYTDLSPPITSFLNSGTARLPRLDLNNRQALIDAANSMIVAALQTCGEEVLGTYNASEVRARPDTLNTQLAHSTDGESAIRLYKRQKRQSGPRWKLQSRDASLTPREDVQEHFTSLFSQPNPSLSPSHLRIHPHFGTGSLTLSSTFSLEAVSNALTWYPSSRSCGADGIHVKLLNSLRDSPLPKHLSLLFQLCSLTGLTPSQWNSTLTFPIAKQPNSIFIPNFRPIALTNMFRRIFERVLLTFLQTLPAFTTISHTQAGFRHGFSTISHSLASHASAQQFPGLHQAFLDLKAAYDTVPIPRLINTLEDRDAPPETISLIVSLFTECSTQVVVNGDVTAPIQLKRGLLQGSILSPLLFNIFIDPLADALQQITHTLSTKPSHAAFTSLLLFADDIKIQHTDPTILQSLLDTAYDWTVHNGMAFNISKCGTLSPSTTTFSLGPDTLPRVQMYKYLGFPHVASGIDWGAHADNLARKASGHLTSLSDVTDLWNPSVKLSIYRSFIRPQLEYGAPLLHHWNRLDPTTSQKYIDQLSKTHRSGVKWICPTSYTNIALSITGMVPLPTRFFTLACSFTQHLSRLHQDNPARQIYRFYTTHFLWSPSLLLPRLFRHNPCNLLPPISADATIARRIYQHNINTLHSLGLMASLIRPTCRKTRLDADGHSTRGSVGPDFLLSHNNKPLRSLGLKWRLNTFGLRHKCPTCSLPFRRTHVQDCNLLTSLPSYPLLLTQYQAETPTLPPSISPFYTIVDFLLNHRMYYHLDLALHSLTTQLITPADLEPDPPPINPTVNSPPL